MDQKHNGVKPNGDNGNIVYVYIEKYVVKIIFLL